jgi:hypothetical protein
MIRITFKGGETVEGEDFEEVVAAMHGKDLDADALKALKKRAYVWSGETVPEDADATETVLLMFEAGMFKEVEVTG